MATGDPGVKAAPRTADNVDVSPVAPTPFPSAQPAAPAQAPASAPALTAEHLMQLEAARAAARRITRAANVARGDGWTVGAFGALSFLLGLGTVTGALVGSGMMVVAFVELRAANRLRRFEGAAAKALAINQLALAALLLAYAACGIYSALTGPSPYAEAVAAEPLLGDMVRPVEDLGRLISLLVYGVVIAVALFFQGGMAMYYFSRAAHVRDYLTRTPPWIVAVQKAGDLS